MKTLFIECSMGAAGDMLMGALMEIAPRKAVEQLKELGIPGVEILPQKGDKSGITGTHVHVMVNGREEGEEMEHHAGEHEHVHEGDHHHHDHEHHHDHDHEHTHEHHHFTIDDVGRIIIKLPVSGKVKKDAFAVYMKIAAAESKVHGKPMDQVHFHELGSMDAVADVVGNCLLMDAIGADKVVVSPINVGSGTVWCAHGRLPVPAPATAEILMNKEYYTDGTEGELCTPTGAALLTYFADEYGDRPAMRTRAIGVGLGHKDFARPNIIRVFLGDTVEHAPAAPVGAPEEPASLPEGMDMAVELSANIDDMTGEELGFAMEALFAAGALDVWYTPIIMKKSRPAVKLSCLVNPTEEERIVRIMFRYTQTAGIRRTECERYVLEREIAEEGGVRVKHYHGHGVTRHKAEYDDIADRASEEGKSYREMLQEVEFGGNDN